jgi:hypothetical protein
MPPPSTLTAATGESRPHVPRSRWPWYAAGGVVAATIAGVVIVLASSGSSVPPIEPTRVHEVTAPVRHAAAPPQQLPSTPPPPPAPRPESPAIGAGVLANPPIVPVKRHSIQRHAVVDAGSDELLEGRQ